MRRPFWLYAGSMYLGAAIGWVLYGELAHPGIILGTAVVFFVFVVALKYVALISTPPVVQPTPPATASLSLPSQKEISQGVRKVHGWKCHLVNQESDPQSLCGMVHRGKTEMYEHRVSIDVFQVTCHRCMRMSGLSEVLPRVARVRARLRAL